MFRYYFLTERFIDVDYYFNKIYQIGKYEQISENGIRIPLTFESLKIYDKQYITNNIFNNENKNEINLTVNYIIYLNLYLNENITELLNSTAIIYTKPISQNIIFSSNKDENFSLNITINSTKNYNYIMQIKFYIDNSLLNYEMLSFAIDMDFKDILKIEKIENDKKLVTALLSTISILIIIVIIVFIYIFKMRKKNKELKERVLSIEFAEGKSYNFLTEDSQHSKKDEEYESVFI